jgi:zinc transport system ATP-binding protein
MSLLTVNNLTLGYNSTPILSNLNLEVEEGDYLCIVGENGSGKSTLMKTLLHLQKPLGGTIVFGEGLKQNEIGYLPQQTDIQKDFPASVYEIVLSGCQSRLGWRLFYNKEDKELAKRNMERMNVLSLAKRCFRELSGGQQQRVLLARALCSTQKVLLLDEPISGLDPKVTAEMYELISKLNKEGITIIVISHYIGAALTYSKHILHLGKETFFGTKKEYLSSSLGKLFVGQSKEGE